MNRGARRRNASTKPRYLPVVAYVSSGRLKKVSADADTVRRMLIWASLASAVAALLVLWVLAALVRATLESVGHDVSDVLDREP
jgi:hypothetical protein